MKCSTLSLVGGTVGSPSVQPVSYISSMASVVASVFILQPYSRMGQSRMLLYIISGNCRQWPAQAMPLVDPCCSLPINGVVKGARAEQDLSRNLIKWKIGNGLGKPRSNRSISKFGYPILIEFSAVKGHSKTKSTRSRWMMIKAIPWLLLGRPE